jgi:PAS domain S-box-containing protein
MSSISNTDSLHNEGTQKALRVSEAVKAAILETALDCIVTIDHAGQVLDFNPAAERTFGYTRAEALGHEMGDLIIPPGLRESHRRGLARAVSSGEDKIVGRRIEITAMRKSGEEFPVELAITRIKTGGTPIFTGHIRDISERKKAEASSRESQQLLASITHNISDGIFRRSPDKGLVYVNQAYLRMFGFESIEALNQRSPWAAYAIPERRDELLALLEKDGVFNQQEVEYIRKDGTRFWGLASSIRIYDLERPDAWYDDGAITDISDRKRIEAQLHELNQDLERRIADRTAELVQANGELRTEVTEHLATEAALRASEARLVESQERFTKAFRASPVFISIARLSDGQFIEVNEAFLQFSGFTREEVIGHTSAELGLWGDLAERGQFLQELQSRGFARNRECVIRSKSGRLDTVLLSAELIEIDGQPQILAVGLNITTRKQAEEETLKALEQEKVLNRLKSNFVSLVSHEFRTPLGVIMSAAEILENYLDRLTPERRREQLQDIHQATRRMSELMEEVLLLAKVEADRMELKRLPFDLKAFGVRLSEEIQAATARVCPIEFTARQIRGEANADESLLRHIFGNLLSNAVKYSPIGRVVQFMVAREEADAVFQVRDQGIGIPEADRPQLFQTFHRGGNVGERPGTGLGLVIVKRCVELHGGVIHLESAVGEGTTVSVRLPLFGVDGKKTARSPAEDREPKAPASARRPKAK